MTICSAQHIYMHGKSKGKNYTKRSMSFELMEKPDICICIYQVNLYIYICSKQQLKMSNDKHFVSLLTFLLLLCMSAYSTANGRRSNGQG